MSPAFSHWLLKRLSAFSKLSSGSTITFVTDTHPFPVQTMDSDLYHAPLDPRNRVPGVGHEGFLPGGTGGFPPRTTLTRDPLQPLVTSHETEVLRFGNAQKIWVRGGKPPRPTPPARPTIPGPTDRRGGGAGGT